MRLLFTCKAGSDGHLDPLLPLVRAAQRAGHDVAIASGAERRASVEALGIAFIAAGLPFVEQVARARKVISEEGGVSGDEAFTYTQLFTRVAAPPMAADLISVIPDLRPEVILHEVAEFGAPAAAAAHRLPWATVGYGLPIPRAQSERAGAAARPLWESLGLPPTPFGGMFEHLYLDPCPPSMAAEIDTPPYRRQLQFQRIERGHISELSGTVARFVDAQRHPLVNVTLGTAGFNRATNVFVAAIEAVRTMDVAAVLTIGRGNDIAALGSLPGL